MATKIVTKTQRRNPETNKVTGVREIQKIKDQIANLFDKLETREQLECLKQIGVASEFYTCQKCNEVKEKSHFYVSTEPNCASKLTRACKECAEEVASPTVDGEKQSPTKETVDQALRLLNKPFLDSLWESSLLEAANHVSGKYKSNVWKSYIKNVQMVNYYTMTYDNSDNYTGGIYSIADMTKDALPKDQEILQQFEKNKNDTLRLLGYLPFEKEKLTDQPFLYSQLIGFLDSSEEGNDDMMRTASIINIVRDFNQQDQINDMIAELVKDKKHAEKNIATIKALQEMKKNITIDATKLAEQSCISLKNSKNAKKGENTWTGKLAKLKEINIREHAVNGFDVDTCKGMQQVADISMEAIIKKLNLQEDEYADMIAEQRVKLTSAMQKAAACEEAFRIILTENLDLRRLLEQHSLLNEKNLLDLDQIINTYVDGGGSNADG